eukprot:symbB.v1.2.040475.t1/scaffold7267.1/size12241/1
MAMRLVVLSLLVPVPAVQATCLEEAIPVSDRQNLVNADGETYPVGFWLSNWAACFGANTMAAILTEDELRQIPNLITLHKREKENHRLKIC